MNIKKQIPNFFTLCNLFCGSIAAAFLFTSHLPGRNSENYKLLSVYFILFILCLIFDFLDGLSARVLNAQSEIGKQLDSLADMVSFGFFPGVLIYKMLLFSANGIWDFSNINISLALFGFLITLFSALRLAKFNLDTQQSYYFKGLPTPANAVFIVSLYWIIQQKGFLISGQYDSHILIIITILSCALLVSNIPLFSLKFKDLSWQNNYYKFLFLGIALILLILWQIYAVPVIILLYIFVSIIFRKKIVNEGIKTE